jgi:hypothetical protein
MLDRIVGDRVLVDRVQSIECRQRLVPTGLLDLVVNRFRSCMVFDHLLQRVMTIDVLAYSHSALSFRDWAAMS